jgi:Flp pilus assembly protein TadG
VIKDDEGNVALIAALCLLPLCFVIGMSIDLSNATRTRLALQDATDSAALAIARNASTITDAQIPAAAKNYVDASYEKSAAFSIATATIERATLTVTINAKANVPTTFAGILGKTYLPVSAHSVVQGQGNDYEIVVVVDNSGSMTATAGAGSSKIVELRKAVAVLLNSLNVGTSNTHVKVGIVPFSSAVNVGSNYAGAAWIDKDGLSTPFAGENFNGAANRFDLLETMDQSWGGCVESRPIKVGATKVDYDINDALPTTTTPQTLFIPWFAPDEPDEDNGNLNEGDYGNNYLNDEGGNCSGDDKKKNSSDTAKQERVCKYSGASINSSGSKGPNFQCNTTAITPLTNDRAKLDAAVSALAAAGNTNVGEGLAWGWRVLSPAAPFTEGSAYTTKNLQKIVILMTDGQNNIPGANNKNRSLYSSYGYMKDGRLDTTSKDSDDIRDKMDERLKAGCAAIKATEKILVYTVALGSDADKVLLSECASGPKVEYAHAPKTGAELTPTFEKIAASINKLRLAQ